MFAFFVPITAKIIKSDLAVPEYAGMKLGEYLRECEASDHMGWNDPVKMQIVQRIQKNTVNAINKHIKDSTNIKVDATASKLSNRLGKKLLPKIGYGRERVSGRGAGSGGGTKITNISFVVVSQIIMGNEVNIDFVLKLSHGKKNAVVSMMIASEAGWIDEISWDDDIGTAFPVEIIECYIESINSSVFKYPYRIDKKCSSEDWSINTDELEVNLRSESEEGGKTQLEFFSYVQNLEISGKIKLRSYDKKYQFTFRVE